MNLDQTLFSQPAERMNALAFQTFEFLWGQFHHVENLPGGRTLQAGSRAFSTALPETVCPAVMSF